ncbi:MAG TPA: hypothetical protein VME66_15185 [Candidatus Acidoferrales bacterium]|nr:hypothetical protein [Candidatus Acidoferrales bacterium]
MDIIPSDLAQAALGARDRLSTYSYKTATTNIGGGFAPTQAAMAGAAQQAIFADALLQAVHARFEELKSVSKT